MTDHPPNPSRPTDQGDNSPSAPGSPQPGIAPGTTAEQEKDNTRGQEDIREEKENVAKEEGQEVKEEKKEVEEGEKEEEEGASAPPLPDEVPPPLPNEVPPGEDDGWEPVWDANAQAYYFYNRFTGVAQWENPRVPDASGGGPGANDEPKKQKVSSVAGAYNPAIHGDYDPTAPYAQQQPEEEQTSVPIGGIPGIDPRYPYEATGTFNRFTGKWQAASLQPENYNEEHKSHRQMSAFFDVDAAANSHDGRSLRAERSAKKLSKKELKAFKDKRRDKKEEKRRAWLRD